MRKRYRNKAYLAEMAVKALVFQHEECEHLGTFAEILESHNIEYEYCRLYESKTCLSSLNPEEYACIISLGGPISVYDEKGYSMIEEEIEIIKHAVEKEKPVIGICLGAQIIAKALGANVYKGRKKEIGWYEVELTRRARKDEIFSGFDKKFFVFFLQRDKET